MHPVGFEPTPPKRLGLKSNALDQLGHGYDTAKRDRYVIRTRNLQDWNLTRYRCANRSVSIGVTTAGLEPATPRLEV